MVGTFTQGGVGVGAGHSPGAGEGMKPRGLFCAHKSRASESVTEVTFFTQEVEKLFSKYKTGIE